MQKHRIWWLSTIVFLVIASGTTALGTVLKHEPSFYRLGAVPDPADRRHRAHACLNEFGNMMISMQARTEKWSCEIAETNVNSFLEESFAKSGEAESLARIGISDINVAFEEKDHLRLAFRYGAGWFSTVVSYDLEIWLVPKEPNVIAVKVLRARAGGLPISTQSVLQQLSEFARGQNYKVTLYRHEGSPVAIIELQPYQPHPASVLTQVTINEGKLAIAGKTLEHALPPPLVKAAAPR